MLTKQKADNLIKIKGEARGVALKVDLDYVLEAKGEEGLKKVEERMAQLGCPIKRKDIIPMKFYPIGTTAVSLLSIKEVFNFSEKDIEQWGRSVVKFSIFMKIFMKYFSSLDLIAKQVPKIWEKHYTVGKLEMPEYSEERKYAILRLRDFKISPIYCNVYRGYFSKTTEMTVKEPTSCKETKCMFRGDPYHEFLLTW